MNKKVFLKSILATCLLVSSLLAGCGDPADPQTASSGSGSTSTSGGSVPAATEAERQFFAMDTSMDVTVYGPEAEKVLDYAVQRVEYLDANLSAENPESNVYELNESGLAMASQDLLMLLGESEELWQKTDGAFNAFLYPVKKAWGFADGNYRVPTEEELLPLLSLADPEAVEVVEKPGYEWGLTSDLEEGETGGPATALFQGIEFKKEGMAIDLGGIAKGYTSDRLLEIMLTYGQTGGKVNLGGNVAVLGKKPDGTPWRVAIQDPDGTHEYLGVLEIEGEELSGEGGPYLWGNDEYGTSVITSGGYERFFEKDGVRYHHILDPATGFPADAGLVSVTVVSQSGMLADALSTALFVMGQEKAEQLWRESFGDFGMVLLDKDGTVHVTEDIAERFTTDYPMEIISW